MFTCMRDISLLFGIQGNSVERVVYVQNILCIEQISILLPFVTRTDKCGKDGFFYLTDLRFDKYVGWSRSFQKDSVMIQIKTTENVDRF